MIWMIPYLHKMLEDGIDVGYELIIHLKKEKSIIKGDLK